MDLDGGQVSSPRGGGRVPEGAGQGAAVTPSPPQAALCLEPLHFLQCHSRNNSPKDLETQLWCCAFEPAREEGACWGRWAVGGSGHTGVLSAQWQPEMKRSLGNSMRLVSG